MPFCMSSLFLYPRRLLSSIAAAVSRISVSTLRSVHSIWSGAWLLQGQPAPSPPAPAVRAPDRIRFTSNSLDIVSFARRSFYNFDICSETDVDGDSERMQLSVLVSEDENDMYTITRRAGNLYGLPVVQFCVQTTSRDEVVALLRHISWFHALLAHLVSKNDGGAVLRMHTVFEDEDGVDAEEELGADLVERGISLPIPRVELLQREDDPARLYCFTLRNEASNTPFHAQLLSLNPELYGVSLWDSAPNPLNIGQDHLVGAPPEGGFRFFLTPGATEDSGFFALVGTLDIDESREWEREAPIVSVGEGRHVLAPEYQYRGRGGAACEGEQEEEEMPSVSTAAVIGLTMRQVG
ncbi:hypothetical protein FB45DRAFT_1126400 [Roridomyces roridus]|uniref:Uncharacterized protein n=1 Tax=Roridomyces roridus TaxID=1738132 RepID=A0AAD7FTI7_9AGAR|nr:hypothetical protein FB45DRAFT_1126400 [Roridomyces roridus]